MDLVMEGAPKELAGCEHSVGVGANGEERRIAEIEEAGEADHDVQAYCQQDIHAGIGRCIDQGPATAAGDERRKEGEQDRSQEKQAEDDGIPVGPSSRGKPVGGRRFGSAHFSGTRIPSSPVGRKTSTRIRMLKIQTSVSCDVK